MPLRGNGDRHRVDGADQLFRVEERTRAIRGGNLLRARAIAVDDGDEIDLRQRGKNPRVMATEMTDPDDGDAQRHAKS